MYIQNNTECVASPAELESIFERLDKNSNGIFEPYRDATLTDVYVEIIYFETRDNLFLREESWEFLTTNLGIQKDGTVNTSLARSFLNIDAFIDPLPQFKVNTTQNTIAVWGSLLTQALNSIGINTHFTLQLGPPKSTLLYAYETPFNTDFKMNNNDTCSQYNPINQNGVIVIDPNFHTFITGKISQNPSLKKQYEAGLAFGLAHEMAHLLLQHTYKTKCSHATNRTDTEIEANELGLYLIAMSGINPREAVDSFLNLAKEFCNDKEYNEEYGWLLTYEKVRAEQEVLVGLADTITAELGL